MPQSTPGPAADEPIALRVGRYDPPNAREAAARDPTRIAGEPEPGVRVVALGLTLPDWAVPTADLPGPEDVELVLVPGGEAGRGSWSDFIVGQPPVSALRLVVRTGAAGADAPLRHDPRCATLEVSATARDRDAVARALAACADGRDLFVGACATDLAGAARVAVGWTVPGVASVLEGLGDAAAGRRANLALSDRTAAGYDGGRLLFQFIAEADHAAFDLVELDACATAAAAGDGEREWILSAVFADRTALVLVAFGAPRPVPAAHASAGAATSAAPR